MDIQNLSPLAVASRELVIQLTKGADPDSIEAGCRALLTQNTNGLGSVDTRVVEVASEIVRGVLAGAVVVRSPKIAAATRGVSETGEPGPAGDAERRDISERTCRDVRDSDNASRSDFASALEGAAPAAKMSSDELRTLVDSDLDEADKTEPLKEKSPDYADGQLLRDGASDHADGLLQRDGSLDHADGKVRSDGPLDQADGQLPPTDGSPDGPIDRT